MESCSRRDERALSTTYIQYEKIINNYLLTHDLPEPGGPRTKSESPLLLSIT